MSEIPPLPPLEQPINLFNIGSYVGQVLAVVTTIQADIQASQAAQSTLLTDGAAIIAGQASLSAQVASLESIATNLATALNNATDLLMIAVQGLGDVATASLQQQEIELLTKIWRAVSHQTVGIDTEDAVTEPQPTPTNPGPLPPKGA